MKPSEQRPETVEPMQSRPAPGGQAKEQDKMTDVKPEAERLAGAGTGMDTDSSMGSNLGL